MVERGGYDAVHKPPNLTYIDDRSSYPDLTDDEFANFREARAGKIASGVLFRSACPLVARHHRVREADVAPRRVGVTHVIDHAGSQESLAPFDGYADTS